MSEDISDEDYTWNTPQVTKGDGSNSYAQWLADMRITPKTLLNSHPDGSIDVQMLGATLLTMNEQIDALTQRVNALEQAQRPQPASVVSVVDWEDNL